VAYGFDADRLLVWLDRLLDDDRARAGALCKRHGSRLSVPRGWWLDDRRVDAPELFRGEQGADSLRVDAGPATTNEAAERKATKAKPAAPRRRSRKKTATTEVAVVEASDADRPAGADPTLDEALAAEHRTGRGGRGGRPRTTAATPAEASPEVPSDDAPKVAPDDAPDDAAVRRHPAATEPDPPSAAGAGSDAVATSPDDPVFAALLEPSSPLLARAFTGAARPDRPARGGRRNGATSADRPAGGDTSPGGPGSTAPNA
jgi:hypothetical protein